MPVFFMNILDSTGLTIALITGLIVFLVIFMSHLKNKLISTQEENGDN